MIPSIKTLQTRLKLDLDTATKLRKVLDGRIDPTTFESVQRWVSQCYNMPRSHELIMCAANEILGTHGVEVIEGRDWVNSFYGNIAMEYCNTGDSYAATLCYDTRKGRYIVSSWGDIVERDPNFASE